QQFVRVFRDGSNLQSFEHTWESPFHQIAILENVGNTGWHAEVVFEDIDLAVAVPDKIRSRNVTPHSKRRINPFTLRTIGTGRTNHFFGDDPVLENLLLVVDVVNERI